MSFLKYLTLSANGPTPCLARETRWLMVTLAAHVFLWTLAPLTSFSSPPLDVVENLSWGREWVLGTYKHPPLQAWLTEIAWQTAGFMGVYALSPLCVVATATALFLLGRDIHSRQLGLCAALIYILSFYATIASPEFNANLLSTPFWAFSSYCLWIILISQDQPLSLKPFLGLALCVAFAFYSKYSVVFLLFGLLYAVLFFPSGWKIFRQPKLYLAIAMTISLCLPNLIWLMHHDFQPFYYALARSEALIGIDRLINPVKFFGGILLAFTVPILLLVLSGARFCAASVEKAHQIFIYTLAVGPIMTMAVFGFLGGNGLKSMWGSSATALIPLALALHLTEPKKWRFFNAGRVLFVVIFLALPVAVAAYSRYSEKTPYPQRTAWRGATLANASLAEWSRHSDAPPDIIVGPTWEAGLVALFAPNRPMVLEDGDYSKSPWVLPTTISERGALVVWTGAEDKFSRFAPFTARGSMPLWHKGRQTQFHWAVLKPLAEQR
jgi:4-amino-4-deoxy-L-arabinose transferase-like glycosyltransferase